MAMGTGVASTYANLFMDSLKQKFIYPHAKCPRIWFRFIDDIWGIFRGTEEELNTFIDYCNSFHETIKFTVEYSKIDYILRCYHISRRKQNQSNFIC